MDPSISLAAYTALLLLLTFVLIKSANLVVSTIHALIRSTHMGSLNLAIVLVAFSTSLPELMVSVTASLEGQNELAVANIIGSNIANISLILGGAALVSGVLRATDRFLKKDVVYVFLIGALPSLLLLDHHLSRLEGIGLVLLYCIYSFFKMHAKKTVVASETGKEHIKHLLVSLSHHSVEKRIGLFIAGMLLMIASAEGIVRVAMSMAAVVNIPVFLIGLIIVAIGTSLPELAFEVVAIKKRETGMAYGNILGSVIVNSTFIIGLSAIIHPISLQVSLRPYLLSTIFFILVFGLFWRFVWTKHRLDRWEGAALMAAYLIFVAFQYVMK